MTQVDYLQFQFSTLLNFELTYFFNFSNCSFLLLLYCVVPACHLPNRSREKCHFVKTIPQFISYVTKILKAMSFNPQRTLTKTLRSLLSDTLHTIEPMGTLVTRASTSQRERGIAAGRNMPTRPIVMVRTLPVIERWIEVIVTPPVKQCLAFRNPNTTQNVLNCLQTANVLPEPITTYHQIFLY